MSTRTALVTGATGHVGARLVPALLDAGWSVRVLARRPERLDPTWRDRVQVVSGDATHPDDVLSALDGVSVAYYLLHSMDGHGGTASWPRRSPLPHGPRASPGSST